jgi:hypothetical protein
MHTDRHDRWCGPGPCRGLRRGGVEAKSPQLSYRSLSSIHLIIRKADRSKQSVRPCACPMLPAWDATDSRHNIYTDPSPCPLKFDHHRRRPPPDTTRHDTRVDPVEAGGSTGYGATARSAATHALGVNRPPRSDGSSTISDWGPRDQQQRRNSPVTRHGIVVIRAGWGIAAADAAALAVAMPAIGRVGPAAAPAGRGATIKQ